jgi:uncharacterized protein (DUF4415 family)
MTEPRRRRVPDGRFSGMSRSDGRPIGGSSEGPDRLLQGSNSELAPIPLFSAQNRLENNCESSSLPDGPPKIPCATEQGINSSRTGNRFLLNRELIRPQQGIRHKSPDASDSRRMPSPSRIKKLSTLGVAKQQLGERLDHADEALTKRKPGQRGPQKAPTKAFISLRIDQDVLERFKADGPGWQSRINDALRTL